MSQALAQKKQGATEAARSGSGPRAAGAPQKGPDSGMGSSGGLDAALGGKPGANQREEALPLAMGATGHTLRARLLGDDLVVTLESIPREITNAIAAQRKTEQGLIAALSGPEKKEHEGILAELDALETDYDVAKQGVLKNTKDRSKIPGELKRLLVDLKGKIARFGAKHGLQDFVYSALNIKPHFETIDNQVNKELRKHVGDSGVLGDGHNNTATAAELLGLITPYPQKHDTRTRSCQRKLEETLAALDQIAADAGIDLASTTEYKLAEEEIEDCKLSLSDPTTYLAQKGFKVLSGAFLPL